MKIKKSTQSAAVSWISTLSVCVAPFILTACLETTGSDNVKTKAIYQSYSVSYAEENSTVSAHASFNVGGSFGTSLDLKSPSRIDFNSHELRKQNFLGTQYVGSWNGETLQPSYTWKWIDPDGNPYVNTATIVPIHVDHAASDFSKSGTFSMSVSGPAFSSQDSFDVEISQSPQGSSTYVMATAEQAGSSTLLVNVNDIGSARKSLVLGKATLTLKRVRTSKLQQSTEEGGSISATYVAKPLTVQITE